MYPDVNMFLQIFANPGEHDAQRMLLNMITTSLYRGAAGALERDDGVGEGSAWGAQSTTRRHGSLDQRTAPVAKEGR